MEILMPGMGEKDEVEKIKDAVRKIDDGRQEYKRQALVNIMFLYGKHHFSVSKRPAKDDQLVERIAWEIEALRKSNTIKRTSNYILPLFRSLYSRLIRTKANVYAEPTTSTAHDKDAARVAKEVINDFWDNCNRNNPWYGMEFSGMQSIMMRLILYKMTIGMGYLIPYFNPKAQSFVYDEASKNTIKADVGEAEIRVASPLNVFRDRFGRHTIERRFISPEQVEYEFDKKVDPVDLDDNTVDAQIMRLLEGTEDAETQKEGVYVYSKYCLPTKEYPDGQYVASTDKEILYSGPLPPEVKQRIPVFEFRYQDLGFSRYGQGAIEQVVDLQNDYNSTLTRISHYKRALTGKVMAPRGSKISAKWDEEVGQILYYNQGYKPSYEQGAAIPAYFVEEIQRIRSDMENLMNSHDVSMGRTPGQVKSGIGIENLSERDDAQIAPELIMFETKLGYCSECVLDIIQERYNERRLLSISGEDTAMSVKSFIGSDLFGQKRIQVRMGSNLPINKTDRMNYILMLKKEGMVSPERAKEMMEFTDIEGALTSLDEIACKQDLLNIIEGNAQVVVQQWEDHTIFLKVTNDFRKGPVYAKLDQMKRQMIDNFATQHQDLLLQEQAAGGGQLPPAAIPQTGAGVPA